MPQERLSHDEFFTKLSTLLSSKKDHGSVFLTQKRLSYDPSNPPPTKTIKKPARVIKPQSQTSSLSKSTSKSNSTIFTKTLQPPPSDLSDLTPPSHPLPILIRASNGKSNDPRHDGKHIKFATVVESDELEAFFARYAECCKAGFTALRKKVRKGKKAKKDKAKTKK